MKKLNIVLLLIIPVIFVIFGFILRKEVPNYFLSSTDPEYCYLFSGLNLANFSIPWHIDHPGSTLQMLCAMVIWVVHLFNQDGTITEDVFRNQELFLGAINITMFFINAILMFVSGLIVSRYSKSSIWGMFIQLAPFMSFYILTTVNRVLMENMMIGIVMVLSATIIFYIKEEKFLNKNLNKFVLIFSIILGFGISTKVLFAPLLIIPFLLLPGLKNKLKYCALTLISFALFAWPIFDRLNYFTTWINNLFVHSGQYGSGDSNIVDKSVFFDNLKRIFTAEKIFPVVFFFLLLTIIIYHLPFLKIKIKKDFYYKALLGVWLAMFFLVIIVAKQFKYYYLTPIILLMPLGVFLAITIYSRIIRILNNGVATLVILIVFLVPVYMFEVKEELNYHSWMVTKRNDLFKTYEKVQLNYKGKPILLIPNYYGAPIREYGLFFGAAWCGEKMRNEYSLTLKKLYPDSYFFHTWNNLFNQWDNSFSFIELLEKYKSVVMVSGDQYLENSLFAKFHGINRQADTKINKVYYNEATAETIYEVVYVEDSLINYICNADSIDKNGYDFANSSGQQFSNGITKSADKFRSGLFSAKLTTEYPYGFTCFLSEVRAGEKYRLSVWKYDDNNESSGIVATAMDPKVMYEYNDKYVVKEGEWVKIQMELVIPENMNNQELKIYCWNRKIESPVYFDDFCIEKLN